MPSPNDPVVPTYATMQWVEERIKKFQMQLGPMKRGPKRWPRKGGGGSFKSATKLAVVTAAATKANYTGAVEAGDFEICPAGLGKCIALVEKEGPGGVPCYTIPSAHSESEPSEYQLRLKCNYEEVGLAVGAVIEITSNSSIPAGPFEDPETAPIVEGTYLQPTDYLRELDGFAPQTILWTHDGLEISWAGEECES